MASDLTPLAVMVLGLVAERPMHPYEMVQTLLARKEDRFANIRPGSLYHTVDRLLGREMLQVDEVERAGNRPERTVYSITATGSRALRTSLTAMLATPAVEFPALYLALAECHELPREQVIELLGARIEATARELEYYRAAGDQAADRGVPEMFMLDLGCRCATLATQVEWLTSIHRRLSNGSLAWPDPSTRVGGSAPCPLGGEDFTVVVGTTTHHQSTRSQQEDVTTS